MVPSDSSEPPRPEVSKVKWFTEGVSFTLTREDLVHFVPSGVNFMQEQHSVTLSNISLKRYSEI